MLDSPASSTSGQSPVAFEGQRAGRACDSCSKKKIKCDGATPRCNYCYHQGIDCRYDRPRRQRKDKYTKKLHIANISKRMELIENLLAERLGHQNDAFARVDTAQPRNLGPAIGNQSSSPPQPLRSHYGDGEDSAKAPVLTDVTSGHISCSQYDIGDVNLYFGVPFLSREGQKWITFQIDRGVPGSLWQNQERIWAQRPDAGRNSLPDTSALPPKSTVLVYLIEFHHSEFSHVFPVADPILFIETLDEAYQPNDAETGRTTVAKACVHAFLGLRPVVGNLPSDTLLSSDVGHCIAATNLLLPDILNLRASTSIVDALVMLAVVYFSRGRIQSVDMILSLVARFLFALGAHVAPSESETDLISEATDRSTRLAIHHREMFWICYTLDKDIAFRTGRPPVFNDASCDLTLPRWYLTQSPDHTAVWRLPSDLRLSLVKSKAYDELYSPQALRKSDADLLKDIRELDDMLETWRQSSPPETRPPLFFNHDSTYPDDTSVRYWMIRLEYHHCLATIHQASSRCKIWADNQVIQQGVSSSLDLALQASRSLLFYFRHAELHLMPRLFWLIIFYPVHAKLTLFCNILLSPASAAARADLQLLVEIYQTLRDRQATHSHKLSMGQMTHMEHMAGYVEELITLARRAVEQSGPATE